MKRRLAAAVAAASLLGAGAVAAAPPDAQRAGAASYREFPGKPTGPIVVEHVRSGAVAVGVPLEIAITARVEGMVAGLGIEVSATVPRAVLLTEPTLADARDGVYRWSFQAVPLTAEAGYLSVIVAGAVDGVEQARSITISLRSGPAEAGSGAPAEEGETLIALPVQESP